MVRRIPISVITGFLGSGKTTMLNYLLQQPALGNAAVLINELGDVGIDHLLVRQVTENVVLLPSGCLCCTVRQDLVSTLRDLYLKRTQGKIPRFERMIIETTGLAEPEPILQTLIKDPLVSERFRLEGVIVTVDAVNGMNQFDQHRESIKQAAIADRLVITKTDLVDSATVDALKTRLKHINLSASTHFALNGIVDAGLLLGAGLYNAKTRGPDVGRWLKVACYERPDTSIQVHSHLQRHDDRVRSYCLTFLTPLVWTRFAEALHSFITKYGQDLLRIKGILNVVGEKAPVVVHGVHHLFHPPQTLPEWPDADRRSHLVFITNGIEREVAENALQGSNPETFLRRSLTTR